MERKLASIRKIKEIRPIKDADKIELAIVDGWQVVVKKDEFKEGELVVYFEIDSFLPIKPEYEFLRKSCYRKIDGEEGFRLRTIKLRGELSQGLILKISEVTDSRGNLLLNSNLISSYILDMEGFDLTQILGVKKYEPPIPVQLAGLVKGNFPSFIPKTDEERVQNLDFAKVREDYFLNGNKYVISLTEKLDGTSFTCYYKDGVVGVCSRNLDLKLEDDKNIYVKFLFSSGLYDYLSKNKKNIAIQGELCGPGIQGNKYNLIEHELFVFSWFDIDKQKYRMNIIQNVSNLRPFVNETVNPVPHLPLSYFKNYAISNEEKRNEEIKAVENAFSSLEEMLRYADDYSSIHFTPREGIVVAKYTDEIGFGKESFKVINNNFLLNEK